MPSAVAQSTVASPEAARSRVTANPSVPPSSASASATDSSAGPPTVAETVFASIRPASVPTDPAGSSMVVSSFEDGRTVIFQRRFSPFATRSAPRTAPLPTTNASSRSVV